MSVYWNKAYVGAKESFDTTRKSASVVALIKRPSPWNAAGKITPPTGRALENAQRLIGALHTSEYLKALRTGHPAKLTSSNGFSWDPGIWDMAVNSTAGILSAIDSAIEDGGIHGSLSSGLHHADDTEGGGFCTVNGLAVGAIYACMEALRHRKSVLIIDFDAHCGGGTNRFLEHWNMPNVTQLDLSVSYFDEYEPRLGRNKLVVSPMGDEYLDKARTMLSIAPGGYGLVLYNAGVDPYPTVSFDALAKRDQMVFEHVREWGIPCVWMLAGGYSPPFTDEMLAFAHFNTYKAAIGERSVAGSEVVLLSED
jgi:acetoin utilization deacetylase AcuC-like enzyme